MDNSKSNKVFEDGYIMGKNDTKLYFRSYEVKESKASIVISHGFCESLEKYKEIIKVFNNNNFSVYILDHRGHGKSDRLGIDNSQINVEKFEYYVDDLKTFLDSVVVPTSMDKKIFLFAHSMGGAIGSLFLQTYDNYFDCAILNCPMMEIDTGKYPTIVSKVIARVMCLIGKGNAYILGHKPFSNIENLNDSGTSSHKRYNSYFQKQLQNKHLQTSGGSFNWLNEAFKVTKHIVKKENVSKIKIPVLLFQAGKDTFVKPDGQNEFAQYALDCKLVIRNEAKHEIYIEKDEILNEYIKDVIEFYEKNLKASKNYN